jgi:hypothetical protein
MTLFSTPIFQYFPRPIYIIDTADGGTRSSSWTPGPSGTALSGSQVTQLQLIRDRDQEFDKDLDEIGEGIQDLHELALRQGEEVRRQNAMLQNTSNRIDSAHEHMTNVNSKMKETLAEVGRSTDKLCVDIMCIVSSIFILFNRVCVSMHIANSIIVIHSSFSFVVKSSWRLDSRV